MTRASALIRTARRQWYRVGLIAIWLAALLLPCSAWAQVMVLLHGHLGSGSDWRVSGFTDVLHAAGWQDGGQLTGHGTDRRRGLKTVRPNAVGTFYTLDLPSEDSLTVQARQLDADLALIMPRHPDEELVFVGFSAGGVVARLYMVRYPRLPVRALATIASPHLGTESAELGLLVAQSPLSDYAQLFDAQFINRSRALYTDLVRERPGSFLYKLNREPHPAARYIAIVRVNTDPEPGDLVVPAYSQDMNNVEALRGRVVTIDAPGVHGVLADDARRLLRALNAGRENQRGRADAVLR